MKTAFPQSSRRPRRGPRPCRPRRADFGRRDRQGTGTGGGGSGRRFPRSRRRRPGLFSRSDAHRARARLEAKLDDGTVLTLGQKGKLTVDEFVYRPGEQGNKLVLNATQGAFLFVGGKIEGPTGGNVSIKTPVGSLGVRGTTVWGGRIDGGFGVLLLKGEVWSKPTTAGSTSRKAMAR